MEIYVGTKEVVPGPIKKEIMNALCRDYSVDIAQGDCPCEDMIIDPANEIGSFESRRQRERSWIS